MVETERWGFDGARIKETKEPERRRFVPETPFGNFADEKGQPCFLDERSEEKRVRPTGPDNFRVKKTLYARRDERGNEDVSRSSGG